MDANKIKRNSRFPTLFPRRQGLKSQTIIVLLLGAGGFFSCNHENRLSTNPADVTATSVALQDSLFEPTDNAQLDSLLRLAAVARPDINLAKLYDEIAEMYKENNFKKAKEYYLKLRDLSEQLDLNNGRYVYSTGYGLMLMREGLTDSALVICLNGLELAKKEKEENWIAHMNVNTGNAYYSKDWYETALQYYMEALPYYEKINDTEKIGRVYYMLGLVYKRINLIEKSIEYAQKVVELLNDDKYALSSLAVAYSDMGDQEKAMFYFREVLRICDSENDTSTKEYIYYKLASIALKDFDLDNAEIYLKKMMEAGGDNFSYDVPYFLVYGKLETLKGNFDQAETHILQALKLADEKGMLEGKKECYRILCELSIAQHKFFENTQYWDALDLVEKAIAKESVICSSAEMEAKYETEKKQLKITALEEEKRFMAWLSISGGAVLLLSLASCFILWRWTVQKKRLAEQQIKQLIQEKQLVATQSVLDGETRERARLARDLHDGLGSLLTGAKLQLLEMKQGVKLEYDDVERFDKALGLLDDSVSEMRRVAHHLMPDSLSRFGLKPAVSDFCTNLPTIQFAYYGDESRLDPNMEVMIYRSIHELVNNALKHAGATRIMVQIIQEPDRIAFTIQDDGCGFSPSATTGGTGLQNIRTRVEAYNGLLDIVSKQGEGTEINVELRINP